MNKEIYAEYKEGVNKWYLIGTTDGPDRIINTTKILDTGKSEYGYINSLTPPYKTKEYLIANNKVLDKPCVECGGVVSTHYHGSELLIQRNMCFGCLLWTDRIEDAKEDRVMIVDHCFYSIASEDKFISVRGFGGAKFVFIKNGQTYESTNVWFGGDIPKHFWDKIPDNAIIVKGNPPTDMSK